MCEYLDRDSVCAYLEDVCAVIWTHEDGTEPYDYAYNWETAQTFAHEGYKVQAIANDGSMEKEEIQRICDYELKCAIDCFGEGHRK